MKTRILALALTLCMLFTLTSTAMATDGETAEFGFRHTAWSSGQPTGFDSRTIAQLHASYGASYLGGFFLGEEELTVTSIEFVPAKGTDADAVIAELAPDYPRFWNLVCAKLGSGVLRVAAGDSTYELPVSVKLPNVDFYTEQRRAAETLISDDFLYNAASANTFWLIREEGFTAADLDAFTFSCDTWDENGRQTLAFADYLSWKHVSRSDGTEDAPRYDLQFTFVDGVSIPETGIDLSVELKDDFSTSLQIMDIAATVIRKTGPSAITASVGGADYTVGFGFVDRSGAVTLNTDGRWSQSYTLSPEAGDSADTPYRSTREETSWGILAASGTASSYTPASDDVQKKITVERVWLERRSGSCGKDGNTNTFSFAQNERLLELTGPGLTTDGLAIYVADEIGEAYLCAAINVNGTPGTVYMRLVYRKQKVASKTFGSIDDLNNWLTKNAGAIHAAAMDTSSDTTWNLTLSNDSYTGTITIPKELSDTNGNSLGIAIWGNRSTLTGSIDLNGAKIDKISHLDFTSKDKTGTAIQNGSAVVDGCTFTGYDTALNGVLFPHNCTFTGNATALVLDVENARLHSDMYNCRFEGNDTAMRVSSITLNDAFLSPYHLRLHDSAFLNNTTDFDVQTAGTFYFLRNYFADANDTARTAKISALNGAKVYADLVWTASPLTTSADARQLVLNRAATALPNDADTQATVIDASALTANTCIDLADERGDTVASWSSFGSGTSPQRAMRALRAASAGAADGFRPGVDIQQTSADTMRVTVADSTALRSKQPRLTVPYTLPNAAVPVTVTGPDGEPVAYTRVGNNLSFRVSAGGTYTVTAALPQVEYADGTITVKNAPADAVQAIAAVYGKTGQLLQTAVAQVQDGTAELPLTVQAGQNCRVFLLDQGNKPVCSTIEP